MRIVIFLAATSLFAQQQKTVAPATARLEGQVVNSQTMEPLRKVSVTISSLSRGAGTSRQLSTSVDGKFAFDLLPAGSYQISIERNGFIPQRYSPPGRSSTIEIIAGQAVTGIDVKLVPQGAIAGKVLDTDNEPMQRVQVSVLKVTAIGGRRRASITSSATTNDLGDFRIFNLPAGNYIVMATASGGRGGPGGGFRGPGGFGGGPPRGQVEKMAPDDYVPTFYPGSIDSTTASLIQLPAGGEITGLSFQLGRSATFRVRGKVSGVAATEEAKKRGMRVSLLPADRNAVLMNNGMGLSTSVRSDGTFELLNVQPAAYQAVIIRSDKRNEAVLGKSLVTVSSGHMDNVNILCAEPVTLTGIVKTESGNEADLGRVLLTLRPLSGLSMAEVEAEVNDDWTFKLEGASREPFTLRMSGLGDTYIKSVRLDAQDVTLTGVDLSSAATGSKLEIILGEKAGSVDGTVKEGEKAAVGRPVTILPDPAQPMQPYLIKTATTDADGKFHVAGLAPGKYRVYAWTEIMADNYTDPDFMRRFQNDGGRVEVKEGSSEQVTIPVIKVDPN